MQWDASSTFPLFISFRSLEHEYDDVQNGDAVSGDAEAGVVDEGMQAEATASADGETEMVEEEKQGEGGLATAEGTEEECAGAETENNNSTEDNSVCTSHNLSSLKAVLKGDGHEMLE